MPLPKPRDGESKDEYVSRCISFATTENEKKPKDEKWSRGQIAAMCYSSFNHAKNLEGFDGLEEADVIYLSFGDASFPDSCFMWVPESAKGPNGRKSDRKLPYKNPDGSINIDHVRSALRLLPKTKGIPEADMLRIRAKLERILKSWKEKHMEEGTRVVSLQSEMSVNPIGNAVIIEGPLLKSGIWVGSDGVPTKYSETFVRDTMPTIIGKPINFSHIITPTSMAPQIDPGTTVGFWTGYRKDGWAKGYVFHPTAIQFLRQFPKIGLSAEVKMAGYHQDGMDIAEIGVLTGGALIDNPACKICGVESVREVMLESKTSLTEGEMSMDPKDEKKPLSQDEFLTGLEKDLTDAKIPKEKIAKILADIKGMTIPPAEPKKGEETPPEKPEEEKPSEKPEAPPVIATPPPAATPPPPDNTALQTELTAMKAVFNQRFEADKTKIATEIKAFDKEFDTKKFLEGVTCPDNQMKMLETYLTTLKKYAKPITITMGEDNAKNIVQKQVEEMFGKGFDVTKMFG